jgi:hypothetical protein
VNDEFSNDGMTSWFGSEGDLGEWRSWFAIRHEGIRHLVLRV